MNRDRGWGVDMLREVKIPKRTKRVTEEFIAAHLNILNVSTVSFVEIELPRAGDKWYHSCFAVGVVAVDPGILRYLDGTEIQFMYCSKCNKVTYAVRG